MTDVLSATESEHADGTRGVDALMAAADELFYAGGIGGVTVAEIRDRSGWSLRRIYGLCPSKDGLVAMWLRHRHRTWSDDVAARVDRALAAGRTPVDAIFDALEGWMVDSGFRGCGFINTHAEVADLTDEHRRIIREHKRSTAEYLDRIAGHGDVLAVLVDGAIVQASIHADVAPIASARRAAHLLANQPHDRSAP